jgi:hypothetical protein
MPKTVVANMAQVGLVKDLASHQVPINGMTDAANVRVRNNSVQKVKGYKDLFGAITDTPYAVFSVVNSDGAPWWVWMSETDAFTVDDSYNVREVTRTTGDYTADYSAGDKWQGFDFSGVFVANNGADIPQMLTDLDTTPTKFTALASWPSTTTCRVLRPFREYMVALDISKTSGGTTTRYPYMVKWSHPADPGTVPASWDETDASLDAGELDLPDGGAVIDCLPLGDVNVIYSETATHVMRYVGGQFVFAFDKIFSDSGILARDCAVEFEGRHLVVTKGDVIVHDGRSYQSVIDKKLKDYFFYSIDPDYYSRSFVVADHAEKEIWVCFPYTGQSWPNKALIYNWANGTWGIRDLPATSSIAEGPVDITNTEGAYDGDTESFDGDDTPMDWTGVNPTKQSLVCAAVSDGVVYLMDSTNREAGTDFTSFVEHDGIVFDDLDTNKTIVNVYPLMYAYGDEEDDGVNIYVGARQSANVGINWEGPFSFVPDTQQKIDCRVTGKIFAIKIESSNNMFWRLDGFDIEYRTRGTR